mgnify:CR=1 FL=1
MSEERLIKISKNLSEKEIIRLLNINAYYYIENVDLTPEHCMAAVKSNGSALKFIPKKMQTREICLAAVKQCTSAIRYVSKVFLEEDMYRAAVLSDNPNLGYVPEKYLTQDICEIAVSKEAQAVYGVPSKFQSMQMRLSVVKQDWHALGGVVESKRAKSVCMAAYEIDARAIQFFPKNLITQELCDEAVEREPFAAKFIPEKYKTNKIVKVLNGLDEGKLLVDNSSTTEKIIEYDEKFYEKYVLPCKELLEITSEEKNEIVVAETVLHETDVDDKIHNGTRSLYYISDIHLMHKIVNRFPDGASEEEIRAYLELVVDTMLSTIHQREWPMYYDDFLLITGDVSFNFEVSEIFYKFIAEKWGGKRTIVTLGNHELWNYTKSGSAQIQSHSVDKIVEKYRTLFDELEINFLENNLLTLTFDLGSYAGRIVILSANEILSYSKEQLQELCNRSSLIVFGALGFSGMNDNFNVLNGIYRDTITSRNEEVELSKKTRKLYYKILDSLEDYKVIIQTHMPFNDWCKDEYHAGWVYVNGHNHRNEFYISHEKTVFADNQIGYKNSNITLKRFNLLSNYDVFHNFKDGIFDIRREEYLDFCKGLGINVDFNRRDGSIKMLKREGFYLFLFEADNKKMYLLKGGRVKSLDIQDVKYYFNNMVAYAFAINDLFKEYNKGLKKISDFVKAFGGSGIVHGCIIDIDFYNHIYLNPNDGKITAYYALSTIDKWVYKDVKSLLTAHCPDLIENYIKISGSDVKNTDVVSSKEYVIALSTYVSDTEIYDPSRIIRSLQYLREVNVIREWNEELLDVYRMKLE